MRPLGPHRSCRRSRLLPCSGSRAGCPTASYNWRPLTLAIIASLFSPVLPALAQDVAPTPQTAVQASAITDEVIVTGSNIPTAEEVGPQPVDTYRRDDIFRLGVRSATDFVQKLPTVTGTSINENINTTVTANGNRSARSASQGNPGLAGWTSSRDRSALPV